MTFGFQQGSIPPGRNREAVRICLIIGPVVESLIRSFPNGRIVWNHPDTRTVLAESLGTHLLNDPGYQFNVGNVRKY